MSVLMRSWLITSIVDPKDRTKAIAEKLGVRIDRVKLSISNFEHLGFFTPTQKRLKEFAVRFIKACVDQHENFDRYLGEQQATPRAMILD